MINDFINEVKGSLKKGGGGVTLPFGERTTYGDTLTWDGNTEGLEYVDMGDGGLYKISDVTPTLAEAQQGGTVTLDGETMELTSDIITAMGDTIYTINNMAAGLIILADNTNFYGVTIPSKGFYMMTPCNFSLTINGFNGFETTETVPLPNKYLDIIETVGGDTLTWDGDITGLTSVQNLVYRVSDIVPTVEDFANGGSVEVMQTTDLQNWTSVTFTYTEVIDTGTGCLILEDSFVIIVTESGATLDDIEFEETGIYFMHDMVNAGVYVSKLVVNGYNGFKSVKLKDIHLNIKGYEGSGFDCILVDDNFNFANSMTPTQNIRETLDMMDFDFLKGEVTVAELALENEPIIFTKCVSGYYSHWEELDVNSGAIIKCTISIKIVDNKLLPFVWTETRTYSVDDLSVSTKLDKVYEGTITNLYGWKVTTNKPTI